MTVHDASRVSNPNIPLDRAQVTLVALDRGSIRGCHGVSIGPCPSTDRQPGGITLPWVG